jgi:hypothetical protein
MCSARLRGFSTRIIQESNVTSRLRQRRLERAAAEQDIVAVEIE